MLLQIHDVVSQTKYIIISIPSFAVVSREINIVIKKND